MKRTYGAMLSLLLLICAGVMPASASEAVAVDLEIREKLFVAQVNEIYVNTPDYLGKTIKYEGMFYALSIEGNETKGMVIRFGPGCCVDDGLVGFEVRWPDDALAMPADNDWVEIIGELEQYDEEGIAYLRLNLQSLQVLAARGQETVLQ